MTTQWTLDEKKALLISLKKHGTSDISLIADEIPFKTISEVRAIIDTYEKLSKKTIQEELEQTNRSSPLDEWVHWIKTNKVLHQNLMPIHRALKYIALFEDRVEANINLSECYSHLADLSVSTGTKQLDDNTVYFLRSCLVKLAKQTKNKDTKEELEYLSRLTFQSFTKGKSYSRKRSALEDMDLNPMNIPKKLLLKDDD